MIERLDKGCKAKVLAVSDDAVLLTAFWPSTDTKHHYVVNGIARNTVRVSREYFERRYGVRL